MFFRRVRGRSMLPTLGPGTIIVATRARELVVGDIVVAFLRKKEVIKRIHSIQDNRYYLVGDNRLESTDSRELGPVDKSAILGVVRMKFRFAHATPAPVVRKKRLLAIPYSAAFVLLVAAVAQLVTFDKLVPIFTVLSPEWGKLLLASLVVSEVFALPFLLRMPMSRLGRLASFELGYIAIILWLVAVNMAMQRGVTQLKLFGVSTLSDLSVIVFVSFVMFVLLAGSSYVLHEVKTLRGLFRELQK